MMFIDFLRYHIYFFLLTSSTTCNLSSMTRPFQKFRFFVFQKYGIHASKQDEDAYKADLARESSISNIPFHVPIHHKILNFVYDKPFYLITGLSVPAAAYIFNEQVKLTGYKFSQRVMHSRIFAQGSVIGILIVTMCMRDYMEKRGRFPETHEQMEAYSKYGRIN